MDWSNKWHLLKVNNKHDPRWYIELTPENFRQKYWKLYVWRKLPDLAERREWVRINPNQIERREKHKCVTTVSKTQKLVRDVIINNISTSWIQLKIDTKNNLNIWDELDLSFVLKDKALYIKWQIVRIISNNSYWIKFKTDDWSSIQRLTKIINNTIH